MHWLAGVVLVILLIPVLLLAALYTALLVGPIPLPFVSEQARAAVMADLPPGYALELGETALALEGGVFPVIQFSPVVLTDANTGGRIRMRALELGFSTFKALIGQPSATVTLVGPHIQVVQDLFGPRLASFEVVEDPNGGDVTVRVQEGTSSFPVVDISAQGLEVRGELPAGSTSAMRSDNDWLIYNVEAAQKGIADAVAQADAGLFSRLIVRDGVLEMHDSVYAMLRRFDNLSLDLTPRGLGGRTTGTFSTRVGSGSMGGTLERTVEADGSARMLVQAKDIDLASMTSEVEGGLASVEGTGGISAEFFFAPQTGKVTVGTFRLENQGVVVHLQDDELPIESTEVEAVWTPEDGRIKLLETRVRVGESSAAISGTFAMGMDEIFGPTIGLSIEAKDVEVTPRDMEAPLEPFTDVTLSGWAAPLYGAVGIDQLLAVKADGTRIATKGRVDVLRRGIGFDLTVAGEGVSADDLKRVWPEMVSSEARSWVVKSISGGTIESSNLRFSFPVGTLGNTAANRPMPQNAVAIDMAARGVQIQPMDGMEPVTIEGMTRLKIRNSDITVSADAGTVATDGGPISVRNAAFVIDGGDEPDRRLMEISGKIDSGVPALIALVKKVRPELVTAQTLPIDIGTLEGQVSTAVLATIQLAGESMESFDYAINGTVSDFGSTQPIQNFEVGGADLAFSATKAGYRIGGEATVQDVTAQLLLEGAIEPTPTMLLSAEVDAADFAKLGVDASEFITGRIKLSGKPVNDTIELAVDLTNAGLTIKDLGISKAVGTPGQLSGAIKQTGTVTEVTNLNLGFGDVALSGSLEFDAAKAALQSAEFSSVQISPGDKAQLSLTPIRDGYAIRLRGEQLDLKPMLTRFFSLGAEGTGGPKSTTFQQTVVLDVALDRALGYYRTTAYNVGLELTLKGSDLQKVNMSAQLPNGKAVSVTTNPAPGGRVMSVAFNDAGSLMRLVGVYPRLLGGEGTLVLDTDTGEKTDTGTLLMRDFALVDEDRVADIVGNHRESRALIGSSNRMAFDSAKVDFVRRTDRVQVTEAILTGDTMGGTMRGFIYTDAKQYDLVGTYVPLSGINTLFQKLPIFGELLGGRDGEGLIGVTFAVRGPLDKPNFLINPASALAIGAFRSLFEFRAREAPRAE